MALESIMPDTGAAAAMPPHPTPPRRGGRESAEQATAACGGLVARLVAGLVDALAVVIMTLVFSLVASVILGEAGADPAGFLFRNAGPAIFLLVYWAYFAGLERNGAKGTIGKNALGLTVAPPMGLGRASLRAAAKLLLGIALPLALLDRRRRSLHDLVAGTAVLRKNPGNGR